MKLFKKFAAFDRNSNSIEIGSSIGLTVLTLSIYVIASVSLFLTCTTWLYIFTLPLCVIHLYAVIKKECTRTARNAIICCQPLRANLWRLRNRAGKTNYYRMVHAFRSSLCIIMIFKNIKNHSTYNLIIPFDAVAQQNYIHLLSHLWDVQQNS